jgi:hypothetical protein
LVVAPDNSVIPKDGFASGFKGREFRLSTRPGATSGRIGVRRNQGVVEGSFSPKCRDAGGHTSPDRVGRRWRISILVPGC